MTKPRTAAAVVVVYTVLLCLLVIEEGSAFSVASGLSGSKRSLQRTTLVEVKKGSDDEIHSDFPPEEETAEAYTGSVDWDAEWKKVVKNGGVARGDRPGKEFYKSEAEIAAIVSLCSWSMLFTTFKSPRVDAVNKD